MEMENDTELVIRATRSAGRGSRERKPRWAHVVNIFAVGRASARELCARAGVDPDETVGSYVQTTEWTRIPGGERR